MNFISTGIPELDDILGGGIVYPHCVELISNSEIALIVALSTAKTDTSKTTAILTTSGALDTEVVSYVFGKDQDNLIGSDKFRSHQEIAAITRDIAADIVILDNITIYPRHIISNLFASMTMRALADNMLFMVISPRMKWKFPPAAHYAGQRIEFYQSDDNKVVARTLKNVATAAFKQTVFNAFRQGEG